MSNATGDKLLSTSDRLPCVVVTSVIRSTHQGQSHGGTYLVDLSDGRSEQVMDWNAGDISWEGRGGDRGLRGIAFRHDHVFLAASNEVLVYDRQFRHLHSITNPYLRHCHEIAVAGSSLYLTSCGFDSILHHDLNAERFVAGYCLRYGNASLLLSGAVSRARRWVGRDRIRVLPVLSTFDPMGPVGPEPGDTTHLNSVSWHDGSVYFSGVNVRRLYRLTDGSLSSYAHVPYGTHNAQPLRDGVLYNNTAANAVVFQGRAGRLRSSMSIPAYDDQDLENRHLPGDHARQAFGRGLTVWRDRYVIAGSSPATITVYDIDTGETLTSVNLSMDVRNAVHGLEIWPTQAGEQAADPPAHTGR